MERIMRILLAVIPVLFLIANAHGTLINVPGDSATIQSAICGAQDGDTVLVTEGTYYERLDFLGKDILLTSNYLFTGDTLTIQNTIIDADTTVLGATDTMSVIVFNNGETSDAIVQGFTIQNGLGVNYSGLNRWFGGGIYCDGTSPTITHNIIRWNSVAHGGGGLCAMSDANVIVTYNTFTENYAGKSGGGGVFAYNSFAVISHNDIIGNFTDTTGLGQYDLGMGGGIYSSNSQMDGSNTITHNNIRDNIACTGGGICSYVRNYDTISNNIITGNMATGQGNVGSFIWRNRGGGISLYHTFFGTVSNNEIADNYARDNGGGIHMWQNHAVYEAHVDSNVIIGNISQIGGGICAEDWLDNGFITCNLVAENVAIKGGGISFLTSSMSLAGNTIAYNIASTNGGGLHGYSTSQYLVEVMNTICWGNGSEIWNESGIQFGVTYCDVEGGFTGVGNINCDPTFCYPDTGNYFLIDTSCCVGAGQGGVDIGAYGIGCESLGIYSRVDVLPAKYSLSPNYPNPFNPTTTIGYCLPVTSFVKLSVYNILGHEVETLVNQEQPAGNYRVIWNADNMTSGLYFYRVQAGEYVETRKMVLLR